MALRFGTFCPKETCMSDISSFRDVMALWGAPGSTLDASLNALASEVGAPITAVRKWWQRERIPAEWWSSVLSTETADSKGVTAELLARLAAREPLEARA